MKKRKGTLGLDPGTTTVGYGFIEQQSNKRIPRSYGEITSELQPQRKRLPVFFQELEALIDELQPEMVVIEEAFYGPDAKTTLKLGQVRGVLMYAAMKSNARIAEYAPTEIKKSVTGSGSASKKKVKKMVRTILPFSDDSISNHASDALACCLCHFHRERFQSQIQD